MRVTLATRPCRRPQATSIARSPRVRPAAAGGGGRRGGRRPRRGGRSGRALARAAAREAHRRRHTRSWRGTAQRGGGRCGRRVAAHRREQALLVRVSRRRNAGEVATHRGCCPASGRSLPTRRPWGQLGVAATPTRHDHSESHAASRPASSVSRRRGASIALVTTVRIRSSRRRVVRAHRVDDDVEARGVEGLRDVDPAAEQPGEVGRVAQDEGVEAPVAGHGRQRASFSGGPPSGRCQPPWRTTSPSAASGEPSKPTHVRSVTSTSP